VESRLAPPQTVARFRRRPDPPEKEVPHRAAFKRNVLLLTEMAKNGGLPWDLILSAELSRHYKPDHETYLKAAELLSLSWRSHDGGRTQATT